MIASNLFLLGFASCAIPSALLDAVNAGVLSFQSNANEEAQHQHSKSRQL
jgi:hypothetical protein